MARDHARLLTSIWADPDFRALTVAEQHAYIAIFSQERLSWCGVLDFIPSRLAVLASDWTEHKVRKAVAGLDRKRYVLLDTDTHEALVRSFVRHDRVLIRSNMGKAVARALRAVTSNTLRSVVLDELGREYADNPRHAGWVGFKEIDGELFERVTDGSGAMVLPLGEGRRAR